MSSAATRVSELFIEFVAASLAFVGLFGHQIRTHRASKFSLDLWPVFSPPRRRHVARASSYILLAKMYDLMSWGGGMTHPGHSRFQSCSIRMISKSIREEPAQ